MACESLSQPTNTVSQSAISDNEILVRCGSTLINLVWVFPEGKAVLNAFTVLQRASGSPLLCSKVLKGKLNLVNGNNPLKLILEHISAQGVSTSRSRSLSPSYSSTALPLDETSGQNSSHPSIVNPLLAFVKAYRLRGNIASLKQLISAHFDLSSLIDAHKYLWDYCGDALEQLGLTYHSRRSTDKRDAFEAILSDILLAISKLDDDKLPHIYCEALHLINLPSLEPANLKEIGYQQ